MLISYAVAHFVPFVLIRFILIFYLLYVQVIVLRIVVRFFLRFQIYIQLTHSPNKWLNFAVGTSQSTMM